MNKSYVRAGLVIIKDRKSFMVACRFLFLIFVFFPILFFSQDKTIITGEENIYVSNALVVVKNQDTEKVISPSEKKEKVKIFAGKEKLSKLKQIAKKRKVINEQTTINKNAQKTEKSWVYNADNKTESFFSSKISFLRQATNPENNTSISFIKEDFYWIVFLEKFQEQEKIQYLFYYSTKGGNFLFTRPPPIVTFNC